MLGVNASELASRLAARAEDVAQMLLPNGRKRSQEWKAGSVNGEAGESLSVRLSGSKAGVWKDFASGASGDLLDLWAQTRGVPLAEAIKQAKQHLGIREERPRAEFQRRQYARPQRPACSTPKADGLAWLQARGLTADTIAAFRIGEYQRGEQTYVVFPYLRDDVLVNAKHRSVGSKRDMRQEKDAEPCLFGWHLIDPNARTLVIAEGEIDAMTLHQAGIPAVSVNAGAGNHQWIESDWDRLQCFSDIVLCYDADEAGIKGEREVAQRLGLERCRIMALGGHKDANEALQAGATDDDFHRWFATSRSIDPDELRPMADYAEEALAMFWPAPGEQSGPGLSFAGRSVDWWEWRGGEVSVWTGINGHGKSLMLMQAMIPVMQHGERICVFSGELPPKVQLKRLLKQLTGIDRPSPEFIRHASEWLRDRAWIFNVVGVATLDRLLEVFRYAARRYGVSHFVIDSLMTTDVPEDGPGAMTAQKQAMRKIVGFAHETSTHVHLVAHPRKAMNEDRPPGKLDVAGSGHITNGADNVWAVWSARREEGVEDEDPDAKLLLLKDRSGEAGARTVRLWFNRANFQYTLDRGRRPFTHLDFSVQEDLYPTPKEGITA